MTTAARYGRTTAHPELQALDATATAAFLERCRTLLGVLDGGTDAPPGATEVVDGVLRLLRDPERPTVWFALAVLSARLPDMITTIETHRLIRLDGPEVLLRTAVATMDAAAPAIVRVAADRTLVDVYQTSRMPRSTGIQRVTRGLVRAWEAEHDIELVGWRDDQTALVELTAEERHHLLTDGAAPPPPGPGHRTTVVVPRRGCYLLPELAVGPELTPRLQALAEYSQARTGVVGFDCVPLTSAETTHPGTPSHFAGNLAAVKHMDRVAAISASAAAEYAGWRTMVGATGVPGPDVRGILLPTVGDEPADNAVAAVRARYVVGDLPMVLVVGTHEPRKNHDGVLHAAELLWRAGHRFSLLFVGGPGWRSANVYAQLDALAAQGRPVETVDTVSEDELWALYAVAHVTLFPSLNEGFGLPVAESLAVGTPVITSAFGSMAEIAQDGGALLVDARDDQAIADALGRVLSEPALHRRLTEEARRREPRTWHEYAREVWAYLADAR